MEGRSDTTGTGSTADEKDGQGEAAGYVLRTGPSEGLDFLREPTPTGLLDRLGQSINDYRAEDPFGCGESDVPVGFGFAEDQFYPDDAMGESNFGGIKGVKCQILFLIVKQFLGDALRWKFSWRCDTFV